LIAVIYYEEMHDAFLTWLSEEQIIISTSRILALNYVKMSLNCSILAPIFKTFSWQGMPPDPLVSSMQSMLGRCALHTSHLNPTVPSAYQTQKFLLRPCKQF